MNDIVDFFFRGKLLCKHWLLFNATFVEQSSIAYCTKKIKRIYKIDVRPGEIFAGCRLLCLIRAGGGVLSLLLIPGGDKYLERRNDIFQGPSFFFPNIGKCSFWRSRAISYEFMQYANTETRMYIHGFISIIILPYIIWCMATEIEMFYYCTSILAK